MTNAPTVNGPATEVRAGVGSFRWVVCGLLFLAATINYVDRQVLGILKPTLQQEFGWSEIDYADIVFSFQLAYAIGLLWAGRIIDKLGAKTGFTIFIIVWSIAAVAHAEAPVFGGAGRDGARSDRAAATRPPLPASSSRDLRSDSAKVATFLRQSRS